jgi:hypothetical protein
MIYPILILLLFSISLLVYVFVKMFRYDAYKNAEIPDNIKQFKPLTLEERVEQASVIKIDRKTARRILRDAKKNPKLKDYINQIKK